RELVCEMTLAVAGWCHDGRNHCAVARCDRDRVRYERFEQRVAPDERGPPLTLGRRYMRRSLREQPRDRFGQQDTGWMLRGWISLCSREQRAQEPRRRTRSLLDEELSNVEEGAAAETLLDDFFCCG